LNHYYIYYRVSENNEADAEQAVRSMQVRLACRSGVPGQLLKKRDDPFLWMEIYEQVQDPVRFERLLQQGVDEFDLDMFLETPRKVECFTGEIQRNSACAVG
jgi:hypothetical protein